jgi:hypothetical protein
MQREGRNRKAPVRPMIRRIAPEPPRQVLALVDELGDAPTYTPIEAEAAPSEAASPISHVARRRASSAPAYEVGVDELEIFDDSEDWRPLVESSPSSSPALPPVPVQAPWQPTSLAPVAFDPAPIPVPLRTAPSRDARGDARDAPAVRNPRPRRHRAIATYGALAMLFVGIGIGAMLRTDGLGIAELAGVVSHSAAAPPPAPTPVEEAPPPVPVVAVSSLPRASVGTVIGAEGHRLWVDSHLADSFTAVVACGHHTVKVGSAGVERDVDVPCGEGIAVQP